MSSSVLKRKLEAKTTVSAAIDGMSGVWADVSRAFLKSINAATGRELVEADRSLGKIDFATMLSRKTDHFPIFLLASRDLPVLGFVYFSQEASDLITDCKLGGKAELEAAEDEAEDSAGDGDADNDIGGPGLLDLLLLQPVAQSVQEQASAAFAGCDADEVMGSAVISDRCTAFKDITGLDTETDLFHLVLTLHDAQADERAVVGLVLRYSVVEKISINASQGKGGDVVDMSNPWQSHMYDVTVGTRVPLKVVLEDYPMTVGDCTRLEIGQTISLAGVSLDQLQVMAQTRDGVAQVGTAALGVYKHNKAVKLLEDPNGAFLTDLAELAYS